MYMYQGGQFYWLRKPDSPKTTSQLLIKTNYYMLGIKYTPPWTGQLWTDILSHSMDRSVVNRYTITLHGQVSCEQIYYHRLYNILKFSTHIIGGLCGSWCYIITFTNITRGCHGLYRKVVWFMISYASSSYHH